MGSNAILSLFKFGNTYNFSKLKMSRIAGFIQKKCIRRIFLLSLYPEIAWENILSIFLSTTSLKFTFSISNIFQ